VRTHKRPFEARAGDNGLKLGKTSGNGAQGRSRTTDTAIFRSVLRYINQQLSGGRTAKLPLYNSVLQNTRGQDTPAGGRSPDHASRYDQRSTCSVTGRRSSSQRPSAVVTSAARPAPRRGRWHWSTGRMRNLPKLLGPELRSGRSRGPRIGVANIPLVERGRKKQVGSPPGGGVGPPARTLR
jgi:hypothetical protein